MKRIIGLAAACVFLAACGSGGDQDVDNAVDFKATCDLSNSDGMAGASALTFCLEDQVAADTEAKTNQDVCEEEAPKLCAGCTGKATSDGDLKATCYSVADDLCPEESPLPQEAELEDGQGGTKSFKGCAVSDDFTTVETEENNTDDPVDLCDPDSEPAKSKLVKITVRGSEISFDKSLSIDDAFGVGFRGDRIWVAKTSCVTAGTGESAMARSAPQVVSYSMALGEEKDLGTLPSLSVDDAHNGPENELFRHFLSFGSRTWLVAKNEEDDVANIYKLNVDGGILSSTEVRDGADEIERLHRFGDTFAAQTPGGTLFVGEGEKTLDFAGGISLTGDQYGLIGLWPGVIRFAAPKSEWEKEEMSSALAEFSSVGRSFLVSNDVDELLPNISAVLGDFTSETVRLFDGEDFKSEEGTGGHTLFLTGGAGAAYSVTPGAVTQLPRAFSQPTTKKLGLFGGTDLRQCIIKSKEVIKVGKVNDDIYCLLVP